MIPTKEEYLKAKEITDAYEKGERRSFNISLAGLKKDLADYFATHKVSGHEIKEFQLSGDYQNKFFDIIPTDSHIEEDYEGENNGDIDKICKKHNIKAAFIYWMYHK